MADAAGRISILQVRCACGKSFENVETYLGHKRLCGTHRKGENVMSMTSRSSGGAATITARPSVPASTPRHVASIACWCSSTLENHDKFQSHRCRCAVYKQHKTACSNTLDLVRLPESNPGAGSVLATVMRPIPPAEATAQEILCPCGKRFTNEKRLENHLRYSKTHQAGKTRSGYAPRGRTPVSVPFMVPNLPPTSIPVSGTIPSSVVSVASLVPCTCGHAFKTQRVLEPHECDSLYHRQQVDNSYTQNRQQDSSLVSSFASLKLEPVLNQPGPSVAKFACVCGRTFTDQKALEAHKEEKGRLLWPAKGENRKTIFKTPRPQYQVDDCLRDISAALALQSFSREKLQVEENSGEKV